MQLQPIELAEADEQKPPYGATWRASAGEGGRDAPAEALWEPEAKARLARYVALSDETAARQETQCAAARGEAQMQMGAHGEFFAVGVLAQQKLAEVQVLDETMRNDCVPCADGAERACLHAPLAMVAAHEARLLRYLCHLQLEVLAEGWLQPPLARGLALKADVELGDNLPLWLGLARLPPAIEGLCEGDEAPCLEAVVTGYDEALVSVTPAARFTQGGAQRRRQRGGQPDERCGAAGRQQRPTQLERHAHGEAARVERAQGAGRAAIGRVVWRGERRGRRRRHHAVAARPHANGGAGGGRA